MKKVYKLNIGFDKLKETEKSFVHLVQILEKKERPQIKWFNITNNLLRVKQLQSKNISSFLVIFYMYWNIVEY